MEQNTLHKQTAKFIAVMVENLPECKDMQFWIENPLFLSFILRSGLKLQNQSGYLRKQELTRPFFKLSEETLAQLKSAGIDLLTTLQYYAKIEPERIYQGQSEKGTREIRKVLKTFAYVSMYKK